MLFSDDKNVSLLGASGIDALAIGNCLLTKDAQQLKMKENYAEIFELD